MCCARGWDPISLRVQTPAGTHMHLCTARAVADDVTCQRIAHVGKPDPAAPAVLRRL